MTIVIFLIFNLFHAKFGEPQIYFSNIALIGKIQANVGFFDLVYK